MSPLKRAFVGFVAGISVQYWFIQRPFFMSFEDNEKECAICPQLENLMRHYKKPVTSSALASPYEPFPVPPDSQQLGNATWTFLHTIAAHYPLEASAEIQQSMRQLLQSVAQLYPCRHCGEHFTAEMELLPPPVQGREALSVWLCERHNAVNEMLNKPLFDCQRVLERWRKIKTEQNV